jgi:hypothetical protein
MAGRRGGGTDVGLLLASLLTVAACGGRSTRTSEEPGDTGTGGSAASGGTGGTGGICEQIRRRYASALREAKTCDRVLGVEQCYRVASDAVLCGCRTYGNDLTTNGALELHELPQEYLSNGCGDPLACEACPEPVAVQGKCGSDGLCYDVYEY